MGQTLTWAPGAKADYVAGDATRAYTYSWSGLGENPSRRVEEAVRQLVFLKPDLVVIFDRVEATQARFEKKWLLHTAGAPRFPRGGRWQTAARGIRALPAGGPFEFTQERGRLTVWPLLPARRKVRALGGRGYECWVEHAPGAPQGLNIVPPGYPFKKPQEIGAWRLELSPGAPAKRDCFLTVLHAGLRRNAPASSAFGFAVRRAGGWTEVEVSRRKRGGPAPWAALRFREHGVVEVQYHYQGEAAQHRAPAPRRVPRAKERLKT